MKTLYLELRAAADARVALIFMRAPRDMPEFATTDDRDAWVRQYCSEMADLLVRHFDEVEKSPLVSALAE